MNKPKIRHNTHVDLRARWIDFGSRVRENIIKGEMKQLSENIRSRSGRRRKAEAERARNYHWSLKHASRMCNSIITASYLLVLHAFNLIELWYVFAVFANLQCN